MFRYWSARVANGENPKPLEVSEACGTTIHAARTALRRYQSGIVPTALSPGLAPKTERNIKPPKRPRKRRTVWDPSEIQKFLLSVQRDRFAALFLLELTTGIRRGQICGLKWSAVDLDAGEITVHDNRGVVRGHARDKAGGKTRDADKTISIDRTTLAALRRWRERQNGERELLGAAYYPGDYVFTFEDGRPPHPDTIRQRFDRLAAAAGLSRITFHDLRRSYATSARKAGLSPKVVSERIGHANVGFFLETYAHVLKNDDRAAAEQAASFLIGAGWDPESDDKRA